MCLRCWPRLCGTTSSTPCARPLTCERKTDRRFVANDSADGAPSLDELPADASDVSILLEDEDYCRRVWASLAGEPDLEEVVRAILDLNLHKPRDIAAALGITTTEVQNRKKRLRRRFIEHHLVNEVHP
jgi:DNA-directed RNA polymerase specialized sigma24 family protein